jgi:hypothetical protein
MSSPFFHRYSDADWAGDFYFVCERTKHIEVYFHILHERGTQEVCQVHFVSANDQLADIFTKPPSLPLF